jgi:uncharacterized protein (DUF2141 family)
MRFLLFCFLFFFVAQGISQNNEVTFSGIRSSKGQIILKIYRDAKSYEDDNACKVLYFKKTNMVKGTMTVKFHLTPDEYGFALCDDENGSNVMNFNFIGIPTEGFGFSNYYLSGMSSPKFESFKLTVSEDKVNKVKMHIRYL